MVRAGLPDWIDSDLLRDWPEDVRLIRIPDHPTAETAIDFWIPPLSPKAAVEVFSKLDGVKVVQSLLAGVDWLLPIVPPGVEVCDGQGLHNVATAEWVVAAILASLKYFPFYAGLQAAGSWSRRIEVNQAYRKLHGIERQFRPPVLVEELAGKTVLIVGYGSIGRSIEERLLPFQVNVVRVARGAREGVEPVSELRSLLPAADVVVLIVPLTAETTHMMGADELGLMKRGALLVNAARGPVVDTAALVDALGSGRIRAALDVTDPEPLPEGHPLWSAPNLLLTPHVAGSSPLFLVRGMAFAAAQLRRFIAGEPLLNVVTGEY